MNEENNNLSNGTNSGINTVKTVLVIIVLILLIALLSFTLYDKVINKNNANNNQTNTGDSNESIPTLTMTDDEIYRKNNNVSDNDVTSFLPYIITDNEKALLQDLVFPFNSINDTFEGNVSFTVRWDNFNIDNMTQQEKNYFVVYKVGKYEEVVPGYDIPEECEECYKFDDEQYNTYVSEDVVKNLYEKIFGKDVEFKNENATIEEHLCGVPYLYDSNSKKYWGNSACGGESVEGSKFSIITKIEKVNDKIEVYLQVGQIDMSNEDAYTILKYNDSDDILWTGRSENVKSNIIDLAKQNKLDSYKFTFKKQSDGKYYIYSGEWQ